MSGECKWRRALILVSALLLACQTWSTSASFGTAEVTASSWLGGAAKRQIVGSVSDRKGPIRLAAKNGWSSSLIHEHHRVASLKALSNTQKIKRGVSKSRTRASSCEVRARNAYSRSQDVPLHGPGRKTLGHYKSFQSSVSFTGGSYSLAFTLGCPPQKFVGVADTGSDLVWVQSAACTLCFDSVDSPFDSSRSDSYAPIPCTDNRCNSLVFNVDGCTPDQVCQYLYPYADYPDGPYTIGEFSTDVLAINSTNGTPAKFPNFKFGLGINNSLLFQPQIDGIFGLGRGPISFISQIAGHLGKRHNKFTYCLIPDFFLDNTSPIVFGEAAEPANISAVTFTPLLTPFNVTEVPFYYVKLLEINIGGTNLSIPSSTFAANLSSGAGGFIFDSGAPYTSLNARAYESVVSAFTGFVNYSRVDFEDLTGLEVCYNVTGVDFIIVPTVTFYFEDAPFDFGFENVVVLFGMDGSVYACLAMVEASPGVSMSVFSSQQMLNFQMTYDLYRQRIGWEKVDCSTEAIGLDN